ncbi:protein MODIFYING WALL LIGNIN-1 [Syzygium oleosum]|uniref:protein MODIFYING WALL LIGNIN-1 n=1 Tax=Syzygium oleosum TaxID=219896 RepID=UPI0024BB6C84|nr:protein MODIFYING WALL LIGNIN-1 [Syzygium oleosum]
MGNRRPGLAALLLSLAIVSLGVAAALSSIAAEIKKTKLRQLKWDGKLCYLPGSDAFKYGVAALACLSVAQVVGYAAICAGFCSRDRKGVERRKGKRLTIKAALFVVSWTSFGVATVVLGAAASMSRDQPYRRGWLNGECYLVRDGVFVASAVLVAIASGSTLCLAVMSMKKGRIEQDLKLHPQAG